MASSKKGSKRFFFEKTSKKLLFILFQTCSLRLFSCDQQQAIEQGQMNKSFLLLFFKKEALASLPLLVGRYLACIGITEAASRSRAVRRDSNDFVTRQLCGEQQRIGQCDDMNAASCCSGPPTKAPTDQVWKANQIAIVTAA